MKKCFIGLGSNERTAARLLAAQSELCMSFPGIVFSRLVQTAPVGFDSPRMFYNQVACFTTSAHGIASPRMPEKDRT